MRKITLMVFAAAILCLLFATVAYASSASYSFSGVTSAKAVKTNTFTLPKGVVTIAGSQTVKLLSTVSDVLRPPSRKAVVRYELYRAATGKKCGSVDIPISAALNKSASFSKMRIGIAPAKGAYYIKISTSAKSVTVSGKGTIINDTANANIY
jgi:hypothetical protein